MSRQLTLAALVFGFHVGGAAIDVVFADPEASTKSQVAQKAFARGQEFKRRGYYKQAWEQFEIARQIAPEDSPTRGRAEQELNYHLPLKQIQDRVNTGDFDRAEQLLNELLLTNQSAPDRISNIKTMLQNLKLMRSTSAGRSLAVDHNVVVRQVRGLLEDFRRARGRYPIGYRELNNVLPPNRPPLQQFLVRHYEGTGAGYVLSLRNKFDPDQVLTIQKTGILR